MRLLRPLLLLAALAALGGCDSEDGDKQAKAETRERREAPARPGGGEERVVREWISALNEGDYAAAARYFAPGAIVDQGRPIRLRDARAARFFNAALPCRADVVEVEDEPGPKALASFALRAGPGGPCNGTVSVRVTVERGRFTHWRQLPQAPEPSGPVV